MSTYTETATEMVTLPSQQRQMDSKPQCPPQNMISSPPLRNASSAISPVPSQTSDTLDSLHTPSTLRLSLTIATPSLVGFIASFTSGIITVGLPTIASSLSLSRALYLWPSSVYSLTSGALLLLAGSIADIIGARLVELTGILFLGVFTLACGFAQTGQQLVAFRAMQGAALALHLPASVAIITQTVGRGRGRNVGFACLGFSQPLGFAVGLVLSGVLIERVGWRSGFFVAGGCMLGVGVVAVWTLPNIKTGDGAVSSIMSMAPWKKVARDVDWIGGLISSGGLAVLAYILAILSADLASIRSPANATLLAISFLFLAAFPFWMHRRERNGRVALIPNKLWNNTAFASTCIMVALSYGVMNSIELFSSLYFQEIQHASTLATSLYLLPNLITGVIIQLLVAAVVHRIPARLLVTGSILLCTLSPLFMAIVPPSWAYWRLALWAQILAPVSADVLFTVGLIIVSDSFPEDMQALAGAVYNTVAQFGISLGMGSCQLVALAVQGKTNSGGGAHGGGEVEDKSSALEGYRASFWLMFAYMVVCGFIAVVGLRKAGKVGVKRE